MTMPWRASCAGRVGRWLAIGGSTLFLWACEVQQPASPPAPAPETGQVLTEHRPLTSPQAPSKAVGEDCTTYGQSECLSGLCLHAKARRDTGYLCSQTCRDTAECPEEWNCVQLMPGSVEAGVCHPPPSWSPAAARPRASSRPSSP